MKAIVLMIVIQNFINDYSTLNYTYTCGIDKSSADVVKEGAADIQTYPWLGVLFYPIKKKPVTTTVILITNQLVLGAALDIDRYPKIDFRARAKIILGHNCTGPKIGIKDYKYHPDYARTTYSALTIIQLQTRFLRTELRPICPPPKVFNDDQVYAMTLSHKCSSSMVGMYKMQYVTPNECTQYYRKFDLDVKSMWPTHFACAKAEYGGDCIWPNGAALAMKQNNRWKLIGFGISGPGCEAPSRFLDYGMHHHWVKNSIARIGRPAVTRIAPNRLIVRRTLTSLQRFGECEPEETKFIWFSDMTEIKNIGSGKASHMRYNLTLTANVEYNCIVLEVTNDKEAFHQQPLIQLRRLCENRNSIGCYEQSALEMDFIIHITYYGPITYTITVYGEAVKLIDEKKVMRYANRRKNYPELVPYSSLHLKEYIWDKFVSG